MDSSFDFPGHQAHRRIPGMKNQGGAFLLTGTFATNVAQPDIALMEIFYR